MVGPARDTATHAIHDLTQAEGGACKAGMQRIVDVTRKCTWGVVCPDVFMWCEVARCLVECMQKLKGHSEGWSSAPLRCLAHIWSIYSLGLRW
jgi:hypothetical protein